MGTGTGKWGGVGRGTEMELNVEWSGRKWKDEGKVGELYGLVAT